MNKIIKNLGFTLIEMVVVVASVGIIVVAVIGTILGTFKSQNRNKSMNVISENGQMIIRELRHNILSSNSQRIVCSTGGTSVSMVDLVTAEETVLFCGNNKIASISAQERRLNNDEVNVTNCNNFVVCSPGNTNVTNIIFNFGLGATVAGVSVTKNFETTVTVRN